MRTALSVVRLGGAALVVAAVAAQMKVLADNGALDVVNFFSYFTIQSNLIGAVALAATALAGARRPRWLEWLRGAAAVYLTVTFVVVIALLQGVDVGLQLVWVDVSLHKVLPAIVVADFLLDPPRTRLSVGDGLLWLAFPLAWLAYTLLRGPIAAWYPYPFLDPANGGYGSVAVTSALVFVGGLGLSMLFVWLGNMRSSAMAGRRTTA